MTTSSGDGAPAADSAVPNTAKEAVCFTAGIEAAAFGAGTIHAYLATDRERPLVVAGISSGAIAAAAMRRCYVEFDRSANKSEADRWVWFRTYLEQVAGQPFDAIWNGLPDIPDFYADHPPIVDPATPQYLKAEEDKALKQRYQLVQLGRWFVRSQLRVDQLATMLVSYVRRQEKYPTPFIFRWCAFQAARVVVIASVARHVLLAPCFYREPVARAEMPQSRLGRFGKWLRVRPLFDWQIWLGMWAALGLIASAFVVAPAIAVRHIGDGNFPSMRERCSPWALGGLILVVSSLVLWWLGKRVLPGPFRSLKKRVPLVLLPWILGVGALAAVLYSAAACAACTWSGVGCLLFVLGLAIHGRWDRMPVPAFKKLGIGKSLIHDYHLRRLYDAVFGTDEVASVNDSSQPHLVIVAAPLQTLREKPAGDTNHDPRAGKVLSAHQVYAAPKAPVVDALVTAAGIAGLFAPTELVANDPRWVLPKDVTSKGLQLIDGSAIRQNPLPAFFRYLEENPTVGEALTSGKKATIHLVYSIPTEGRAGRATLTDADANVVDVGVAALRLTRRCDTQMEVRQTQFLSNLYRLTDSKKPAGIVVDVDEIAPDPDTPALTPFNWFPDAARRTVAEGCKRTLQVLHREALRGSSPTKCSKFRGLRSAHGPGEKPGLPEVCAHCDGMLSGPIELDSGKAENGCEEAIKHLSRTAFEKPRIILVANGGVFRGSFHVGLAGALWVAEARPDLIVGASVGTLMGGVVGAMFQASPPEVPTPLHWLVESFMRVDQQVALTKTLKTAARELGLRGRGVQLSPKDMRDAVRAGSRGDAGFAATGAPPVLIDALSDLFMIPHAGTAAVARRLIAGNVTGAVAAFGRQLKAHTLQHLGIQDAAMGSSLIQIAAHRLLGGTYKDSQGVTQQIKLNTRQPYSDPINPERRIAIFGTTTDLGPEALFLLGRAHPFPNSNYDFVQSTLASSAFPFVFSPRRESDVYPGIGNRERRFSDGGLFDNLPFAPAIEILAEAQASGSEKVQTAAQIDEVLKDRTEYPDLFLAGALDPNPEQSELTSFEDIESISNRGKQLRGNVKIRGFELVAKLVDDALPQVSVQPKDRDFLLRVVNAGVLPIFPSDTDHLNPTFAFCASMGLKRDRVADSIANGCFRTLAGLTGLEQADSNTVTARALTQMREIGKIQAITVAKADTATAANQQLCPYFKKANAAVTCPFHAPIRDKDVDPTSYPNAEDVNLVRLRCGTDPVHETDRAALLEKQGG